MQLTRSPGNAHTELAAGHVQGALQPDGRMVPEPTFDVQHVADAIVHIASLPNSVTVLEFNIMLVSNPHTLGEGQLKIYSVDRAAGVPFVGRG
jgi:hypothetical protein